MIQHARVPGAPSHDVETVQVRCADGVVVETEAPTACLCHAVARGVAGGALRIAVPHVDHEVMLKVLRWIRFHRPPHVAFTRHWAPPSEQGLEEDLTAPDGCATQVELLNAVPTRYPLPAMQQQYDANFVAVEPAELCELASAAYYLDLKPLVDLTCQAIAGLIQGKSPEEVRQTFRPPAETEAEEPLAPQAPLPPPPSLEEILADVLLPDKPQLKAAKEKLKKRQAAPAVPADPPPPPSGLEALASRRLKAVVRFIEGARKAKPPKRRPRPLREPSPEPSPTPSESRCPTPPPPSQAPPPQPPPPPPTVSPLGLEGGPEGDKQEGQRDLPKDKGKARGKGREDVEEPRPRQRRRDRDGEWEIIGRVRDAPTAGRLPSGGAEGEPDKKPGKRPGGERPKPRPPPPPPSTSPALLVPAKVPGTADLPPKPPAPLTPDAAASSPPCGDPPWGPPARPPPPRPVSPPSPSPPLPDMVFLDKFGEATSVFLDKFGAPTSVPGSDPLALGGMPGALPFPEALHLGDDATAPPSPHPTGGFSVEQFQSSILACTPPRLRGSPPDSPPPPLPSIPPFSMFAGPPPAAPAPLLGLAIDCPHQAPSPAAPLCPACVREAVAALTARVEAQQRQLHSQAAALEGLQGALAQLQAGHGGRSVAPGLPLFSTPDFLKKNGGLGYSVFNFSAT